MADSIDDTFASLAAGLPATIWRPASVLLSEIGIDEREGVSWDGFLRLEPNRNLPLFACKGDEVSPSPQERAALEQYTVAHHCGLIYGVVVDRIADGQAVVQTFNGLEDYLLDCWERSLATATGDRALAERAIALALRAWRLGVELEKKTLRRGSMRPDRYVKSVSLKLAWLGVAAECLLVVRGDHEGHRRFRRAYHLMLLSLQCLDDAVDAEGDAAINGFGVPEAMGYPREAFVRASARLARDAAAVAKEGGFLRLCLWLQTRADQLDALRLVTDSPRSHLGGLALASSVEAAWDQQFARQPCETAATT